MRLEREIFCIQYLARRKFAGNIFYTSNSYRAIKWGTKKRFNATISRDKTQRIFCIKAIDKKWYLEYNNDIPLTGIEYRRN